MKDAGEEKADEEVQDGPRLDGGQEGRAEDAEDAKELQEAKGRVM